MANSNRILRAGSIALALALFAGGAVDARTSTDPRYNRGLESVHQPVVSRTDFVLDVAAGPGGLAPGERERLAGWFDGLRLNYGDSVTVDRSAVWQGVAAEDAVGAVVAHYGLLVSHAGAPATAGHPAAGSVRVVVSRAVAQVEGCPDWSTGTQYGSATASNFGCATATNLAAMIANPQDLVEGRQGDRSGDDTVTLKAIKAYRDAQASGAGGLKSESSKSGGGGR